MEGIPSVVRWVAKDKVGVEFDVPLYEPIVEHLSSQNPRRTPFTVTVL